MIETKEVAAFFDRLAEGWDADMVRNEEVIARILDNAGVCSGKDILDVATGTGVLIPDYLSRGAASVTGIDLSPRMAEIARAKFPGEKVTILCGDARKEDYGRSFDCIVIYNAFPHFSDPRGLIARLSSFLKPGGILSVAHGSGREKINEHHRGCAPTVSQQLMPAEELAEIFAETLEVTVIVSEEDMYQVAGRKN